MCVLQGGCGGCVRKTIIIYTYIHTYVTVPAKINHLVTYKIALFIQLCLFITYDLFKK